MRKVAIILLCLAAGSGLAGLTGFGVSGPVSLDNVAPNLNLISPIGGESWPAGSTHPILWSATDSHFGLSPIDISYTLEGTAFIPLFTGIANDGTEAWTLPNTISALARVRIKATDSFGNHTQRTSLNSFQITDPLPMPPGGVNVEIVNNWDALLTWLPVTQNVDGSPFTPDGYIVLFSEIPGASIDQFFFLGDTAGLSYTHLRVAHFRTNMFYRVLAYSEPRGGLNSILAQAGHSASRPVSYSRLKLLLDRAREVSR